MAFQGPIRKISSNSNTKHSRKRIKLYSESFSNLDDCINSNFNYESMRSRLASHPNKTNTKNSSENTDLLPIIFGLIVNTINEIKTNQKDNFSHRKKHTSSAKRKNLREKNTIPYCTG